MVDWWSVGIILYEMLFGFTPFLDQSRAKVYENIMKKQLQFPSQMTIPHSNKARNLIMRLLSRKKERRIGHEGGYQEILAHEFFSDLDIDALERRDIEPPCDMVTRATENSNKLVGEELEMSVVPQAAVKMVQS